MDWLDNKVIVVPTDYSDQSREALDKALEIAGPTSKLHVIHVAPDLMVMEPGLVWDEMSDETRRENLEKAFAKHFPGPKYEKVEFQVRFGDPGQRITEYAEEVDAELIVIPSHGRTGVRRLLIGSVAERVVRLAPCPVLVLRHMHSQGS